MTPANRQIGEMAIEQSSGAPVSDNGKVIAARRSLQNLLDCANDSGLGGARCLPTTDTDFGLSKESIDSSLKLFAGEVTGRRPIIFPQTVNDPISREPESFGENLRTVSCLALAACKDAMHDFYPANACQRPHACSAMLTKRPVRNGDVRINHNIRMGDEENRRQWTLPFASARPRYPPARISNRLRTTSSPAKW